MNAGFASLGHPLFRFSHRGTVLACAGGSEMDSWISMPSECLHNYVGLHVDRAIAVNSVVLHGQTPNQVPALLVLVKRLPRGSLQLVLLNPDSCLQVHVQSDSEVTNTVWFLFMDFAFEDAY